jgi:hypothetical protein
MKRKLLVVFLFLPIFLFSQESSNVKLSTGVDFVSSYNWRAIDFGNSPAIQPYLGLSAFGFDFTIWGSHSIMANEVINEKKVAFTEIDLILRYSQTFDFGTLYTEMVDFYYPFMGEKFSNYKGVEDGVSKGAHWINLAVGYQGSETFPLSLKVDFGILNDVDNNIYIEAGYTFDVNKMPFNLFMGLAKGKDKSDLYGIEDSKIALINCGFGTSKEIKITDNFSLPISSQLITNPYASKVFLVFKVSL